VTTNRQRATLSSIVFGTTALRIVCAAAIAVCAVWRRWDFLLPLALLAFASDFLDGWLARRWRVTSNFGSAFDPLADKVVCLTLLAIAAVHVSVWYWILFAIFGAYDIYTMTIRFVLSRPMPASRIAKLKTALLMAGLVAMLVGLWVELVAWIAAILLSVAALLTIRSFMEYTRAISRSLEWLEFSPGVTAIDFAAWHKQYGIRAVLFDIEGTLTPWADPQVDNEVASALRRARKSGIVQVGLVSNMRPRHSARAAAVANQIDAATYHVPLMLADRKPSPAMVYAALSKLDVPAREVAFVGDKLVDVLAAHRAGIARVAWVDRLGSADHPLEKVFYRPLERAIKWTIR